MDARLALAVLTATVLSLGANYRTENFIVTARSESLAQEVARTAEQQRRDLALQWLGRELAPWGSPCPIRVHVGDQLGAGGATTFAFVNGAPVDWRMTIQGSRERVLDSVLPHEITHTVFATHFGRPLPRWADEGACTTVEHVSERRAQHDFLIEFLNTERGIPFNRMFRLREYPRDVMPLYSQGYSVARFLIQHAEESENKHAGHQKFIRFVGDGMKGGDWNRAVKKHYRYRDLSNLQLEWVDWVKDGSPLVSDWRVTRQGDSSNGELLASREDKATTLPVAFSQREPKGSQSSVNWYLRQAKLSSDNSSQENEASRTSRPEGERKILLEWRGEPEARWSSAGDRILR